MWLAAKEAVEKKAKEKGRQEERERIGRALEEQGVTLTPEILRILAGESVFYRRGVKTAWHTTLAGRNHQNPGWRACAAFLTPPVPPSVKLGHEIVGGGRWYLLDKTWKPEQSNTPAGTALP
jgi:hypothetical protein